MKAFITTVLVLVFSVAIIRLAYGQDPNSLAYSLDLLLKSLPNVREDFQVVIDAISDLSIAIEGLFNFSTVGVNPFKDFLSSMIDRFFNVVASFLNVPIAIGRAAVFLLNDIYEFFGVVASLLFDPAVAPIVPPIVD